MHGYHEKHGHLPPAAVYDQDGKPLLSWRVALLPYLEEKELFDRFHLDEPWDSPHNMRLLSSMPRIYASPVEDLKVPTHESFIQVFVGKGTAFEPGMKIRIPDDFLDGAAQTCLLIESGESVPWTKPAELNYDPEQPLPRVGGAFRSRGRFSLFGENRFIGAMIALADASVRPVSAQLSEVTLRAIITRNGQELLGNDW